MKETHRNRPGGPKKGTQSGKGKRREKEKKQEAPWAKKTKKERGTFRIRGRGKDHTREFTS